MSLWFIILGMGVITVAIRLAPIILIERGELPPVVRQALRYVPPAVLSAIFIPEMLQPNGNFDLSFGNARLLAGILAIVVAWRTRNIILTIIVGMSALWILLALA
jgi:branched-subunit amino acid transport protein